MSNISVPLMIADTVPSTRPNPPPPNSPKPRRGPRRDRNQLLKMQETLFELTQDSSVQPHIRAACARAWSDLQERKRVLDGKPLPGQLRPDGDPFKARQSRRQKLPSVLPMPEVPTRQELPTTYRQDLPSASVVNQSSPIHEVKAPPA